MPQVFRPAANVLAKASLVGLVVVLLLAAGIGYTVFQTRTATGVGKIVLQPIPFGHEHHVGLLKFDCRYCHQSVEYDAFAGIPPTQTCMNCHSEIWSKSDLLAPVRRSAAEDKPIVWERVHNLADFVYFDHSIHVNKGVGCVSCHGRVDRMPVTAQVEPMTMAWCLDCHWNPESRLRPPEGVFDPTWQPPPDIDAIRADLMKKYDVKSKTDCSDCHR